MSCCTTNPKDLCKISACAPTLATTFAAPDAGTYTLVLSFQGAEYRYEQDFDEDEHMDFDLTAKPLNEKQEYVGKILDEDGDVVLLMEDPETYDGIRFETIISL